MDPTDPTEIELENAINEALRPISAVVSPTVLSWMRTELRLQMLAHPYTASLLAELAPAPVVQQSGPIQKDDDAAAGSHPVPSSGQRR